MARLNYSEKIDKKFPKYFRYRSLRTLFDPLSSEWFHTDLEKKSEILKNILTIEPMKYWVKSYLNYYQSINKGYVKQDLPIALFKFIEFNELDDEELTATIKNYLLSGELDYYYAFNNEYPDKLPHQVLGDEFLEVNAPYIIAMEERAKRRKELLAKLELKKEKKLENKVL